MVKEPHPKSQLQGKTTTTTVTTAVAKGVVVGVDEGGSKKLLKKKKEKEKEGKKGKNKEKIGRDEKGKERWWARGKGEVQYSGQQGQEQRQVQSHPYQPSQAGKHGSSSQVYPYPHQQQQQVQVQTGYANANAYPRAGAGATGGYGSRWKDETEEEEETGEEEEETGEDTGEEGKKGAWSSMRPGSGSGHERSGSWYYTQPLVDETSESESGRDRGRSGGRSGSRRRHERYAYDDDDDDEEEEENEEEEEEEETPRKTHIRTRSTPISTFTSTPTSKKQTTTKRGTVLRVKEKVDPYAGYEDVSPIGVGNLAKAKVRPRSFYGSVEEEEEEEEEERPPRRGRGGHQPPQQHQQRERERDWHHDENPNPNPTHAQTQAQAQAHQRSRSAIEEREKQVLIARARARSASRPRAGGSRGGYENEDEGGEEEEGALGLAYDDEQEREEEGVFRGRGGGNNKSTTTSTGRAGLPQPPAMVRHGAVGITGNVAGGRKIQGGPRWKSSSSASLRYGDGDGAGVGERGDGRGGNGNSGGSDEYGYDYGHQNQSQSQSRVAILQSAPGAVEGGVRKGGAGAGRAWPTDLPRLPRTPGGTGTGEERGNYFDLRSQSRESASHIQTQGQGGRAASEFSTRGGEARSQSQGPPPPPSTGATRSASRDHDLDLLDDPPPQASVVRTPSPGAMGGYVLQKRKDGEERGQGLFGGGYHRQHEQQQEQERGYESPLIEQGQGQGRPQSQMYGYPPPPQQRHQAVGSRSPFVGNQQHQQLPPPQHPFHPRRKQPQTPAPLPTVGIESPHPVGGRDRLADMNKLEGDSDHGSDHERFSVNGDVGAGVSSSPMMMPRIGINAATSGGGGAKTIPTIQIGESEFDSSPRMGHKAPMINVSVDHGSPRKQPRDMSNNNNNNNNGSSGGGGPRIQVFDVPGVSVSGPEFDDDEQPGPIVINVSGPGDEQQQKPYSSARGNPHSHARRQQPNPPPPQSHFQHPQGRPPSQFGSGLGGQARSRPGGGGGLACGGCHGQITNGRIVSAMGLRWHPTCFKCSVCSTPLEHVSSYEHEGRPYCHLDYHEVGFFFCFAFVEHVVFFLLNKN